VDESDERELFDRARGGDRAAFDRLQTLLEPKVRRFVVRLVGAGRERDIAQDAFHALWLNIERLAGPEHVRPFLFRVARNLSYDELRRQGRFDHVSLDDAGLSEAEYAALPPAARQPEERAHWVHLWARVRETMDRLPEPQRQALILYAEEDFTYEQIAEIMGTDIGTVKSRIHYGRRNLLRLLPADILRGLGIEKE